MVYIEQVKEAIDHEETPAQEQFVWTEIDSSNKEKAPKDKADSVAE